MLFRSLQGFSLSVQWQLLSGYALQGRMDRDKVIVDFSPQAADPLLEKITGSRSPETQKCNIQEIDEGKRITRKIFHFENCGTVYMDSLNAHNVKIKNCGNNVPNVTCSLFYLSPLTFVLTGSQLIHITSFSRSPS